MGGAIDIFGGATLTVSNSTFTGNQAPGGAGVFNFGIGGAIENNAGFAQTTPSAATIDNRIFVGNVASGGNGVTGNGGALDNEGTAATMTVSNSVLVGNQSEGGPEGGQGRWGGILNVFGSNLTLVNSLLANNQAVGGPGAVGLFTAGDPDGRGIGGGIDNEASATLTVRNSSLTGNHALGGAGSTFGGTLATSNVSDGDGGGIANGDGPGGAIAPGFNLDGASLTLIDSAVSGNVARGPGHQRRPWGHGPRRRHRQYERHPHGRDLCPHC